MYLVHYTTPTGRHNSREFETLESAQVFANKRPRVWSITEWHKVDEITHGKALFMNLANY